MRAIIKTIFFFLTNFFFSLTKKIPVPFVFYSPDNPDNPDTSCQDVEADRLLSTIVDQAIALGPASVQFDDADSTILLRDWCLREHIHKLRRLQKEIVERVRSLRYFQAIRAVRIATPVLLSRVY